MKKRISILALLCLTLATLAFGVDKLITAPSGDLILDAKTGQKIVIKKEIEAQVQSPGFVPIGGMVAVMPHVSGSWQPPASGAVKDGFMRADGSTVTDGDSPLNGEVLPNMASNTYARGDSTSGGTGGANTQASNVTVGNHAALSLQNHNSLSATIPNHQHQVAETVGSEESLYMYRSDGVPGWIVQYQQDSVGSGRDSAYVNGNFPANGGGPLYSKTDGGGGSVSFTQNITSHSFTQNIDVHSVINNTVNNEPKYVSVIWVIRVK